MFQLFFVVKNMAVGAFQRNCNLLSLLCKMYWQLRDGRNAAFYCARRPIQWSNNVVLGSVLMKKFGYGFAAVTLLFFISIYASLHTDFIANLDEGAKNLFYGNRFLAFFHYFGEPAFVVVVAIVLMLFLWLRAQNYRAMLFVLATFAGGTVINQVLKVIIQRPRPERLEQLTSFSFPSGHSMGGILYLLATAYIITQYTTSKKRAAIIWLGAIVLTMLIGLARVAESRHFMSDVFAGWSLGFTWFMICVFWYESRQRHINEVIKS